LLSGVECRAGGGECPTLILYTVKHFLQKKFYHLGYRLELLDTFRSALTDIRISTPCTVYRILAHRFSFSFLFLPLVLVFTVFLVSPQITGLFLSLQDSSSAVFILVFFTTILVSTCQTKLRFLCQFFWSAKLLSYLIVGDSLVCNVL